MHDFASHGADSFGLAAVVRDEVIRDYTDDTDPFEDDRHTGRSAVGGY